MAVKRVTESYSKGIQAIANARRTPQSPSARAPTHKPAAPAQKAVTPPEADEFNFLQPEQPRPEQPQSGQSTPEQSKPELSKPEQPKSERKKTGWFKPQRTEPEPSKSEQPAVETVVREGGADAIASIAADISKLQRAAIPEGDRLAPVDYHDIIANTVATLDNSTAEARHAVYECARQVVYQRLARIRPPLSVELTERERLSLDLAIERIESKARKTKAPAVKETSVAQLATAPAPAAPRAIAPVVIAAPHRELPQARHFHGGALRLFGITGLICAGMFGYWLVTGKPEIRTAVTYLNKLPILPPVSTDVAAVTTEPSPSADAPSDTAVAETVPSVTPMPAAPAAPADEDASSRKPQAPAAAERAESVAARSQAENPLINLNVGCGSVPCANAGVTKQRTTLDPAADQNGAWWTSTYPTVAPTRPGGRGTPFANGNASARLMAAGRAASVPTTAADFFDRGMLQSRANDPERAIRDFTDAIRLDPNFSDAFLQRGNMRFKNGSPDPAIDDFRDAIQAEPRNAAAFKARGMALLYKGDENAALEDLTRSIQIAETDPSRMSVLEMFFARRSRSALYGRRQNGDRELFDLSAMIDAYWKNPELADALKVNYGTQGASGLMAMIYRQRANLYVQRANNEGAITDLSFALQLDPQHALPILADRARVQEAAGRRAQAAADLQRALEINPRFDEARQALARLKTGLAPVSSGKSP